MGYLPPYTLSERAVSRIAEIAVALERYRIALEGPDGIRLRRINHVKTIRGTTAIEGNTLTEAQVTAILGGKRVIASEREIAEIKGAHAAYEMIAEVNPYDEKDLLRVHRTMMASLVKGAGGLRTQGVGVVDGYGNVLHMAPPAGRVPELVGDLFAWLKSSEAHPLVKSSVFHYEFEFIHPFLDGNGRMGRYWQTAILGKWNDLFYAAPVENLVYDSQSDYYAAIQASTAKGDSGPFIDFMLDHILATIRSKGVPKDATPREAINEAINEAIKTHPGINRPRLLKIVGKSRATVERALAALVKSGLVEHRGSKKTGGYFSCEKAKEQ